MNSTIVEPVHVHLEEYYEAFPLLATCQDDYVDYEVYPILDTCKKTRLHHNLINDGFGILFCNSRSPMMLIISLQNLRLSFFEQRTFDAGIRAK